MTYSYYYQLKRIEILNKEGQSQHLMVGLSQSKVGFDFNILEKIWEYLFGIPPTKMELSGNEKI